MKYTTLVLISFVFFFSCENICLDIETQLSQCNTEKTEIKTALHTAQVDLQKKSGLLNGCIDSLDICSTQSVILEMQRDVCSREMQLQKNYYRNVILEKDNLLEAINKDYDELYSLHVDLLNDNYVILKSNVIKQLTELNALILEGETALNQLQNIEQKDETVLDAIKTTEIELAYNKGKRTAIGFLTGIQVQN